MSVSFQISMKPRLKMVFQLIALVVILAIIIPVFLTITKPLMPVATGERKVVPNRVMKVDQMPQDTLLDKFVFEFQRTYREIQE